MLQGTPGLGLRGLKLGEDFVGDLGCSCLETGRNFGVLRSSLDEAEEAAGRKHELPALSKARHMVANVRERKCILAAARPGWQEALQDLQAVQSRTPHHCALPGTAGQAGTPLALRTPGVSWPGCPWL